MHIIAVSVFKYYIFFTYTYTHHLPHSSSLHTHMYTNQQCFNSIVVLVICRPVYGRLSISITQNNISTL